MFNRETLAWIIRLYNLSSDSSRSSTAISTWSKLVIIDLMRSFFISSAMLNLRSSSSIIWNSFLCPVRTWPLVLVTFLITSLVTKAHLEGLGLGTAVDRDNKTVLKEWHVWEQTCWSSVSKGWVDSEEERPVCLSNKSSLAMSLWTAFLERIKALTWQRMVESPLCLLRLKAERRSRRQSLMRQVMSLSLEHKSRCTRERSRRWVKKEWWGSSSEEGESLKRWETESYRCERSNRLLLSSAESWFRTCWIWLRPCGCNRAGKLQDRMW